MPPGRQNLYGKKETGRKKQLLFENNVGDPDPDPESDVSGDF
jgi:hypothetical protein